MDTFKQLSFLTAEAGAKLVAFVEQTYLDLVIGPTVGPPWGMLVHNLGAFMYMLYMNTNFTRLAIFAHHVGTGSSLHMLLVLRSFDGKNWNSHAGITNCGGSHA